MRDILARWERSCHKKPLGRFSVEISIDGSLAHVKHFGDFTVADAMLPQCNGSLGFRLD